MDVGGWLAAGTLYARITLHSRQLNKFAISPSPAPCANIIRFALIESKYSVVKSASGLCENTNYCKGK